MKTSLNLGCDCTLELYVVRERLRDPSEGHFRIHDACYSNPAYAW
jgi:hypothetical protein